MEINVIFFEQLSQSLMVSHSNCRQLPPVGGIVVIVFIEVVPRSVSEHTQHLVYFGVNEGHTQKQQ